MTIAIPIVNPDEVLKIIEECKNEMPNPRKYYDEFGFKLTMYIRAFDKWYEKWFGNE